MVTRIIDKKVLVEQKQKEMARKFISGFKKRAPIRDQKDLQEHAFTNRIRIGL